jgi:hypothetical protein
LILFHKARNPSLSPRISLSPGHDEMQTFDHYKNKQVRRKSEVQLKHANKLTGFAGIRSSGHDIHQPLANDWRGPR